MHLRISQLGSSLEEADARRVVILSTVRATSEGLAHGLQRYMPLEILKHGTLGDKLDIACTPGYPATLVFDGSMPRELGRLRDIGRTLNSPRVVVYGLGDVGDDVRCCARHQVTGLVARDAPMSDLAEAIQTVCDGEHYISASLLPRLMQLAASTQQFDAEDLSRLTRRETQVATRLGRGLTYAQIATDLLVSPATVKNHVHNIYCKLRNGSGVERDAGNSRDASSTRGWTTAILADRRTASGNE